MNVLRTISAVNNAATAVNSAVAAVTGATGSTASTGTGTSSSSSSSSSNSSATISETQFLTLLTQQLESQDPLQPMDDTQFLAQMAQFTSLQETDTLNGNLQNMEAGTFVGSTVTVSSSGSPVTGQVTGVDTSGTTPNLIINGQEYPLTSLQLIQQASAASAGSGTSSTTSSSTGTSTTASSTTGTTSS